MSFKLLGIRPLKGCSKKFTKNLNTEHIYQFYKDYEFKLNQENVVIEIINNTQIPYNLYNQNEIDINISAIVGKNGSGKSTLIELLTASLNQLSKKLSLTNKLNTNAELIYISEEVDEIYSEIYYELNNSYYRLSILNENYELIDLSENKIIDLDLNSFFYTQIVNYSLYAFNSWEIGEWVDKLFHKNDSYQIPVVITPKRESLQNGLAGIIDINNENYLLNQRLLSNVISNPKYKISNTNEIRFLKIIRKSTRSFFAKNKKHIGKEFKSNEINFTLYKQLVKNSFSIKFTHSTKLIKNHFEILTKFKKEFEIDQINLPEDLQIKVDLYIIYKIIAICEKYLSYKSFIIQESKTTYSTIYINGFLDKISSNNSHITIKLLQVINFVKYYDSIWKNILDPQYIDIQIISEQLKELATKTQKEILEYLPPPIFECHLISENYTNILDSLSSGEKQLVHFTSNILYHLININSVKEDDIIKKYRNINIVLDEIELYFHPQYQKDIIYKLLNDIKLLKLNDIKSINIIFITHSPFILSDIPKNNVLFLEKGNQINIDSIRTFGGNLNNIFTNSFFLDDGLIGNYSKEIINNTIKEIKKDNEIDHDSIIKYINLIDEPIVRNKLFEMYFYKYPERNTDNKLKIEQIKRFARDLGIKNISFK